MMDIDNEHQVDQFAKGSLNDYLEYLSRLENEFNRKDKKFVAFVSEDGRFERLRNEAQVLFENYPDPQKRPSMFGLLVGVKDIFHVSEHETRAGSQLPQEVFQVEEAESVRLLKEAGALIIGKTVTTEFAYFAPGATRNPHNVYHTPGGSSSGSAAAVSLDLCHISLGTQTIGSITRPAAFCGVTGYKPSYDRISRFGVIPLSNSLDHVGVFAKDVSLTLLAASNLVNSWNSTNTKLNKGSLTLGIPEGPYLSKVTDEGRVQFLATCNRLAESGVKVKPINVMNDFDTIVETHNLIVAAEAANVHKEWFKLYQSIYHEKTVDLILRGQAISSDELHVARQSRLLLREKLQKAMCLQQIDAWVSPGAPGVAPKGLASTGDPIMNLPWTHSGLPTLAMPSGNNEENLPFGLQLAGRFEEDEMLYGIAMEIERLLA